MLMPLEPRTLPTIETVEFSAAEQQRRSSGETAYHRTILVLSAGLLFVAFLMEVHEGERVAFRFAPKYPLPDVCQTNAQWGIDCPGCGLTRCFIFASHGDVVQAADANVAGLFLVLLVLAQVPYRLWALRQPYRIDWRTRDLILLLTIPPMLLWGQWAFRLFWSD